MTYSPLTEGFRAGLRGREIDTARKLDTSTAMSLPALIRTTAAKFRVHPRTVRRWRKAGVDIANDLEVASHIALKGRSAAALKSAIELIKKFS